MWRSLLFGIYRPLQDYQASATRKFSKPPARKAQKYGFDCMHAQIPNDSSSDVCKSYAIG